MAFREFLDTKKFSNIQPKIPIVIPRPGTGTAPVVLAPLRFRENVLHENKFKHPAKKSDRISLCGIRPQRKRPRPAIIP
jgi:hypothetical protein